MFFLFSPNVFPSQHIQDIWLDHFIQPSVPLKMPQSGLGSMQGSTSTKSRLPPKVVFYHRSSSTKGRLPIEVVFHYNTLVHLIFVRAVNIPNLSFLPAVHDAWCMMHDAWCNTLDDLIFVRAVNIPKPSLRPCIKAALKKKRKHRQTDKQTDGHTACIMHHVSCSMHCT